MFTHSLLQQVSVGSVQVPLAHGMAAAAHFPAVQAGVALGHMCPQLPQLFGSLEVSVQLLAPASLQQAGVIPVVHATPQVPQFDASSGMQLPPQQTSNPEGQGTPSAPAQPPQLSLSVCVSTQVVPQQVEVGDLQVPQALGAAQTWPLLQVKPEQQPDWLVSQM